jgi:hypothetical protein
MGASCGLIILACRTKNQTILGCKMKIFLTLSFIIIHLAAVIQPAKGKNYIELYDLNAYYAAVHKFCIPGWIYVQAVYYTC